MTLSPLRLQRRQAGSAGREILRFPVPVASRLAVIDAEFHLAAHMRTFDASDFRGLMSYAPEAMALPVDAALSLADRKLRGLIELPGLKLALVVFSSAKSHGALESHHRDLLWKAFGLPVFEQMRDARGHVIARECEVHDGLHLDAGLSSDMAADIVTDIVTGQCDCGLETPRMYRRVAARARAAAAA